MRTEQNPTGEIEIQKIDTVNQLATIMTKSLVEAKFTPLRDRLMGWDLKDGSDRLESNIHSRGSVENVSVVQSLLKALIVEISTY